MPKFFQNKLFRYFFALLILNISTSPVESSSALAAWSLKSNGILELRTKASTKLEAIFKRK